ncbi:MAG: putative Ig domain-containing protein [Bordetella sp.]|nr:putative Ig domain-containing protein [Bordetella sp.]
MKRHPVYAALVSASVFLVAASASGASAPPAERVKAPVGHLVERVGPGATPVPTAGAPADTPRTPARARGLAVTSGTHLNSKLLKVRTTGGTGSVRFRLLDASGKPAQLPPGLVFGDDGSLSGEVAVVTAPKTMNYVIEVRDAGGGRATKAIQFTINPPLNVGAGVIRATAGGKIRTPIKVVKVSGGTGSYTVTYADASGGTFRLPPGLVLDGAGNLSGAVPMNTDKLAGLAATVADEGGASVSVPLEFSLGPALEVATVPLQLTAGAALSAPVPVVSASGGSGAVHYLLLDKDGGAVARLPDGLRFDAATGTVSGQAPSLPQSGGFMIYAQDAGGGEARGKFEWTINKPLEMIVD